MLIRISKLVATGALASAMALGGTSLGTAAPMAHTANTAAHTTASCNHNQATMNLTRLTSKSTVQALTRRVSADIASRRVVPQLGRSSLNMSGAKVYAILTAEGVHLTSVTIPIQGTNQSVLSGLTVLYRGGKLASSGEVHVTKNKAGHFQITTFNNGKRTKDVDSGVAWRNNATVSADLRKSLERSNQDMHAAGWGAKVGCVAATLGISYYMAQLVVGLCGGSCATAETNPISAGVCAACITGIVAAGTTSLAAVYKCFDL